MGTETLYNAPDKQIYQLIKEVLKNPNIQLTTSGELSYASEVEIDKIIYNIVNNK